MASKHYKDAAVLLIDAGMSGKAVNQVVHDADSLGGDDRYTEKAIKIANKWDPGTIYEVTITLLAEYLEKHK